MKQDDSFYQLHASRRLDVFILGRFPLTESI